MFLLVFSIVFLGVIIWYKLRIRRLEKMAANLPGDPCYTVLGDLKQFLHLENKDPAGGLKALESISEKYLNHGLMKFWFGPLLLIPMWDASYIEVFLGLTFCLSPFINAEYYFMNGVVVKHLLELIANNRNSTKKGKLLQYLFGVNLLKGVLVNEGNEDWKELRKPLNLSMNKKLIESQHHKVFVKHTMNYLTTLKAMSVKKVNILRDMQILDFEIFGETHIGIDASEFKEWSAMALLKVNRRMSKTIKNVIMVWPFLSSMIKSVLPDLKKKPGPRLGQVLYYRRKRIAIEGYGNDYYTDFLIKRGLERGHTDRRIVQELMDVLSAGSETSSFCLASLLTFLAMHPDIQEEVFKEQEQIFGDELHRIPDPGDLSKMHLLHRAIKETLRHVSPPMVSKLVTEDLSIGGHTIPKDSYIIVFMRKVHYHPGYWEKPRDFFPDHFLPENVQARPDFTFIPFGVGIRRCPGEMYAITSIAVVVSILIRNFRFNTKWKYEDIVYEVGFVTHFQNKFYELELLERH